jgi:hypothetical protein
VPQNPASRNAENLTALRLFGVVCCAGQYFGSGATRSTEQIMHYAGHGLPVQYSMTVHVSAKS